jgi:hypothetical protein
MSRSAHLYHTARLVEPMMRAVGELGAEQLQVDGEGYGVGDAR